MPTISSALNKKPLTIFETADAWAFFTIRIWKEKMLKYKVGKTGKLAGSLSKSLSGIAKGENLIVRFDFLYYGKFVDMGVGRGTPLGGVKENKISRGVHGKMTGNRRYPKKWYSKTLFAETATLKEILAREFAHRGTLTIVENLNDNSIKK